MKTCNKCGEVKEYSSFCKNKRSNDGFNYRCKECASKYYIENKSNILKKIKEYQTENKCIISTKRKERYTNNRDNVRMQQAKYYADNKNDILKRQRDHYISNRSTILKRQSIYNKNNRSKKNKYESNKCRTDISYRIARNIRSRIGSCIRTQRTNKNNHTFRLLGCDKYSLMAYLEQHFYDRSTGEEMSWENYGLDGWHIDHIRPCASFDLTDPEQQKECFHYTNLQPLWAEDNLRKSDKWDG